MRRDDAVARDAADPLRDVREEFETADGLLYLDGNSLGRLPTRTVSAIERTVRDEWGSGLVSSWRTRWMDLPFRVGDDLAPLIGAGPGEVVVCDQTSVNLYKLAWAALDHTGRVDIVSDGANFPSDLYILEGLAAARGGRLRVVGADGSDPARTSEVIAAVDGRVGLVALSHVDYRTGAIADMAAITAATHDAGALALWDLSHSVGILPVDLHGHDVDLAVGCTYKYLNGGPGAPAFLFVKTPLQQRLVQPIHGWFGHADPFAFEPAYRPVPSVARFTVGTPPIVSLRGAAEGIALTRRVGTGPIRNKSVALTGLLIDRFDERLAPLGFRLVSPRDPVRRGGHVGIAHSAAWQINQAVLERDLVPDFRAPDVIRLAPVPLYTRFVDVWDAVEIIADVVASGAFRDFPEQRDVVT